MIEGLQRGVMKGCNEFKRMIDEAERPDRLPFEVTNHIEACADCGAFSAERISLREMVMSMARVGAPANFDAQLNARIAATRAGGQASWIGPALYFRLGAVAAGVVVTIFVAQLMGFFSPGAPTAGPSEMAVAPPPVGNTLAGNQQPRPLQQTAPVARDHVNQTPNQLTIASGIRHPRRVMTTTQAGARSEGFVASEGAGMVLVRGQSGERELTVPAVSLGAQPLLYVNAGRTQSQQPRSAGTSF